MNQIIPQPRCIQGCDKRMRVALPSLRGPGSKLGMLAMGFFSRFLGQRRPKSSEAIGQYRMPERYVQTCPLSNMPCSCCITGPRSSVTPCSRVRRVSLSTVHTVHSAPYRFVLTDRQTGIYNKNMIKFYMVERVLFGDICSTWGYKGELLTGAWHVVIRTEGKTRLNTTLRKT